MKDLLPSGLTTQMPVGQMPVGEKQAVDPNTRQIQKGGPPWMCGQHNITATVKENTEQNTKDPFPEYKLKVLTRSSTPSRLNLFSSHLVIS